MGAGAVVSTFESTKRKRVYVRKFDWNEARRRRDTGESYSSIARDLGVSVSGVQRACNADLRVRMDEAAQRWKMQGACAVCGGPATRVSLRDTHGRCRDCFNKAQATSVRETELLCFRCKEWKPDEDFPRNKQEGRFLRRGRHNYCRSCNTIERREYRERNRERDRAYDRAYRRSRRSPLQVATSRPEQAAADRSSEATSPDGERERC
jgi:hypothetical protein